MREPSVWSQEPELINNPARWTITRSGEDGGANVELYGASVTCRHKAGFAVLPHMENQSRIGATPREAARTRHFL